MKVKSIKSSEILLTDDENQTLTTKNGKTYNYNEIHILYETEKESKK